MAQADGWERLRKLAMLIAALGVLILVGFLSWRALAPTLPMRTPVLALLPYQAEGGDAALAAEFSAELQTMAATERADWRLITAAELRPYIAARDIAEIRRRLDATHVVDGAIERRDGAVIVTTELRNARSADVVWRLREEVPESEIPRTRLRMFWQLREVMRALHAARGAPIDPQALEIFANARVIESPPGADDSQADRYPTMIAAYRAAIGIEPDFALAWARLADVFAVQRYISSTEDVRAEAAHEGDVAAERAVTLAPLMADAWRVRADFTDFVGDPATYRRYFARALELGRDESRMMMAEAQDLARYGRIEDAMVQAQAALDADPYGLGTHPAFAEIAGDLPSPESFDAATRAMGAEAPNALERHRDAHLDWLAVGETRQAQSMLDAFAALLEVARTRPPGQYAPGYLARGDAWLADAHALQAAMAGRAPQRRALADTIEARAGPADVETFYAEILPALAVLGETERAYALWQGRLDRLPAPDGEWHADQPLERETYHVREVVFGPGYRTLRADPRFWRMIARLEFPAWWLSDARLWAPDFCRDPALGYDCTAIAREAFADVRAANARP